MKYSKKWLGMMSKKRLKKQVIQYTLMFLALLFLVTGCYLILDNSLKLTRSYKSNKNTSVLADSMEKPFLPTFQSEKPESRNQFLETLTLTIGLKEIIQYEKLPKSYQVTKSYQESQVLYDTRPEIGEEFGELYIPKLDAVLPIFEGTSEDELELGVGHYIDSVLPGENDNSVLAGHRDTVFRRLGEVGVGDSLIVRVQGRELNYKVMKVRIVDKEDRTVIVPRPRATLTISTCYPFSFIGAAPKRYVLIGYLIL